MIILSIILTYHAVLLPGLLLQHDDPVRGLVQGGGQTVPLSIQRLPNIKIVQFHEKKLVLLSVQRLPNIKIVKFHEKKLVLLSVQRLPNIKIVQFHEKKALSCSANSDYQTSRLSPIKLSFEKLKPKRFFREKNIALCKF